VIVPPDTGGLSSAHQSQAAAPPASATEGLARAIAAMSCAPRRVECHEAGLHGLLVSEDPARPR
jgi:hypothetical protein